MTNAMLFRVSGLIFGLAIVLVAIAAAQPPLVQDYVILNPQ